MEDLGETLRLPDPKGNPPRCGSSSVTLVFLEGVLAGQVIPLVGASTVIGRQQGADLMIGSQSVSKRHCVITRSGDSFFVEDLDSTNGVLVNDAPVSYTHLTLPTIYSV